MKKIMLAMFMFVLASCVSGPAPTPQKDMSVCGRAAEHVENAREIIAKDETDKVTSKLLSCVETEFGDAYFTYSLEKHHAKTDRLLAVMPVIMILKKVDGEWLVLLETAYFHSSLDGKVVKPNE